MESEEFEQIPWASLVAEQREGVDKRIYLAVGVVGLLVAIVFGMRLFSGSQPTPPQAISIEPTSTTIAVAESSFPPQTLMVVAEADLRVEEPAALRGPDLLAQVTAEWFVTDWFTRDGSQETARSVRSVLSPALDLQAIPHERADEPVTFVEWAKTVETEVTTSGFDLTVLYRAIRETEDGFVREPVKTVSLSLEHRGSEIVVSSLPLES